MLNLTANDMAAIKPLVVLLGPTAIGKSRVAIEVAKTMKTEVLTADSRQVYRGMDIGTDKPTIAERQGVPHRLIDLVDPDQPFNVGDYRRHAEQEIDRLHQQGTIPLVSGGTGLYIRALLRGLWSGPSADWTFRNRLDQEAKAEGKDYLYKKLSKIDPVLAERLHPHDHVKIQRGLEVYHLLGTPLSQVHHHHGFQEAPYRSVVIGLTMERESLYKQIDDRVELEIAKGLIQETQRLMDQGFHRTLGSMKSLGYRQIAGLLEGEYSYEEALRQLKRDTRHFAKRQMTWFRKEPSIHWLHIDKGDSTAKTVDRMSTKIQQFLSELADKGPFNQSTPTLTSCKL